MEYKVLCIVAEALDEDLAIHNAKQPESKMVDKRSLALHGFHHSKGNPSA